MFRYGYEATFTTHYAPRNATTTYMENTRGSNSREVSYERFAIIQEKLKWNIYWREKYPDPQRLQWPGGQLNYKLMRSDRLLEKA